MEFREPNGLRETVVGTVTLRASDPEALASFYTDAIGLKSGSPAGAFELADSEGRKLLRITQATAPADGGSHLGLFHTAFRFRDRGSLGDSLLRLARQGTQITGAADHGVSEAIYLDDPAGNGIELYYDYPYAQWRRDAAGELQMGTWPADINGIVGSAHGSEDTPLLDVGHIHLKVSDLDQSLRFYTRELGLNTFAVLPGAGFVAEGSYHHHVGMNTWRSAGAPPLEPGQPGLESFELLLTGSQPERLREDPDGIQVLTRSRS